MRFHAGVWLMGRTPAAINGGRMTPKRENRNKGKWVEKQFAFIHEDNDSSV